MFVFWKIQNKLGSIKSSSLLSVMLCARGKLWNKSAYYNLKEHICMQGHRKRASFPSWTACKPHLSQMVMLLPTTSLNIQNMGMEPETCHVALCLPAQIQMQIPRYRKRRSINSHRHKRQSNPVMIFSSLVHLIFIAWQVCLPPNTSQPISDTNNKFWQWDRLQKRKFYIRDIFYISI